MTEGHRILNGSCNCGQVKVSLKLPADEGLHVCHCIDCRKFTGAIAAFLLQVPGADFTIDGEYTEWWTTGDSGGKVGRFFCGVCGRQVEKRPAGGYADVLSSLYDEGECDKGAVSVHGGLFPPASLPAPVREIYLRDKEAWETGYPGVKAPGFTSE